MEHANAPPQTPLPTFSVSSPPPLCGAVVGNVVIEELVAEGGMGYVYRGQQQTPQRTVAVKFMRSTPTPAASRRFRREVETLGRLSHPHIAPLYEAGEYRQASVAVPYYVMQFIPAAVSLVAFCQDHQLSTADRLRLFLDACDAIAAGHAEGVVHLDIKPSNLLVSDALPTDATVAGNVQVIDFGIARVLTGEETTAGGSLTGTSSDTHRYAGTPPYMSPEQLQGAPATLDARSDVYALGVVLGELLTGLDPQQAATCPPLHISDRSLNARQLGFLRRMQRRCLARDPGERYPDAGTLAEDLRRLLASQPLAALPSRGPRFWRRRGMRIAQYPRVVAVTLLLLAGGVTGGLLWLTETAPRPPRPPWATAPPPATTSLLSYVGVSPDFVHASHASGADPTLIPVRIAPLEWLRLRFEEPLTAAVLEERLTTSSFQLTRNGLPVDTSPLTLHFDQGNLYSCHVSDLERLTTPPGHYTLAVTEPVVPHPDGRRLQPIPTPLYSWDMPAFSRTAFSLHDADWKEHVHSLSGLGVHTDTHHNSPAIYLRPTEVGKEGVLVMRFTVDFPIHVAWLEATMAVWTTVARPFANSTEQYLRQGNPQAPIDPDATITLEVSRDGVAWHEISRMFLGHAGISRNPYDVSSLLQGSQEAWVRARLVGGRTWQDNGVVFTQFLRSPTDNTSPAFRIDLTGRPPAQTTRPQPAAED